MASVPNSLEPTRPMTKMMSEGSREICILDDSHRIGQVIEGERTTPRVLSENSLPKGIYQLGEATKAGNGKDASLTGQMLFSDSKVVYQLSGKGAVEHPHSTFIELEAKNEKTVNGRSYTMAYANDKDVASNAQTADVTQLRATSRGRGASV